MADCSETLRELELFLDGELSGEKFEHVRNHLDECIECYHAFDFHAELKQVIAEKVRTEQMPDGLLDRIRQCFLADTAPPPEATEPA